MFCPLPFNKIYILSKNHLSVHRFAIPYFHVCLSVCQSVCMSLHLSVCLSVSLSVCFSVSVYGFDQQRLIWCVCRLWDMVFCRPRSRLNNISHRRQRYHINLCWSNPYSAYSPTQKKTFFSKLVFQCFSGCLFVCLSVCLFVYLYVYLSVRSSVCLSICLSVFPWICLCARWSVPEFVGSTFLLFKSPCGPTAFLDLSFRRIYLWHLYSTSTFHI